MALLILGLAVWFFVHLVPCVARSLRASLINSLGGVVYRGLFSVIIIASVVLMVMGWKASVPSMIYTPPIWGRAAASVLMLLAFVLFFASEIPTNLRRMIRHPQMSALVLWSSSHLMANGDSRSVILFSTLGIWAVVEMVLISRRDGPWQKPEQVARSRDIIPFVGGAVIYCVVLLLHPYLSGVAVISFE